MSKFLYIINIIFFIEISPALGSTEAGMPQLNPEFWVSQVFWLIFIFTVLYIIIWKLIIPKITESLESRKKRIINDLDEAQKLKNSAEEKLDEYKSIIENSKNQAKKIILDSKRKMEQDINNKRKKFDQEIQTELKNAENQIKDFKNSSIESINKMSVEISNEIIKSTLNIDANTSNVTAIVEEVSRKKIGKII